MDETQRGFTQSLDYFGYPIYPKFIPSILFLIRPPPLRSVPRNLARCSSAQKFPVFPPRLSREQTKSIFSNSSLFPSQLLANLVDVPVTCYTCIRVPREQPYLFVGKGAEREEEYVMSHVSANREGQTTPNKSDHINLPC